MSTSGRIGCWLQTRAQRRAIAVEIDMHRHAGNWHTTAEYEYFIRSGAEFLRDEPAFSCVCKEFPGRSRAPGQVRGQHRGQRKLGRDVESSRRAYCAATCAGIRSCSTTSVATAISLSMSEPQPVQKNWRKVTASSM